MKKVCLLIALLSFLIININAEADAGPEITKTEYKAEKITVEGTGAGQIQLVLFNLQGSPLYLTTIQANEGVFSITLPKINGLADGDYKIKVADYNGANVNETTVTVKTEKNPLTGDNIMLSIITGGVSVLGIVGCVIFFKKKLV